jgi:hypothetical protein
MHALLSTAVVCAALQCPDLHPGLQVPHALRICRVLLLCLHTFSAQGVYIASAGQATAFLSWNECMQLTALMLPQFRPMSMLLLVPARQKPLAQTERQVIACTRVSTHPAPPAQHLPVM